MQANKLKSYMALKGETIKSLAATVGMASKTLSEKINGKSDFTLNEAEKLIQILGIDDPADVFFN